MSDGRAVLAVDDDLGVLHLLQVGLEYEGYSVQTAKTGAEALNYFSSATPQIVILDVILPDMNGFDVCRRIRSLSPVPIIMLTALGKNEDVIHGLDAGADDFVVKPFVVGTLAARIRAVLRRAGDDRPSASTGAPLSFDGGRLIIDLDKRVVIRNGVEAALSATEHRLLSFVIANRDRVVSHQAILEHVWGPEYVNQSAYLRTYVGFLRRKIEDSHQRPKYLLSSHGVGYLFDASLEDATSSNSSAESSLSSNGSESPD